MSIICHFDGSYDFRIGIACYRAVIRRNGRIISTLSNRICSETRLSNNVAEYAGLIAVLRFLLDANLQHHEIVVYSDAQLVIKQMFGRWRIKRGRYVAFAREAKSLLSRLSDISGYWVPRHRNRMADQLARLGL
jgi:ribonuclease HI